MWQGILGDKTKNEKLYQLMDQISHAQYIKQLEQILNNFQASQDFIEFNVDSNARGVFNEMVNA